MVYRWLSNLFFLAGMGCFGLAGYMYWASPRGSQLEVPRPEIEIPDCISDRETLVAFHLYNHSSLPMRVLGLTRC